MEQVKIFKGVGIEIGALEQEINDWLKEADAQVINVTGNIAPQSGGSGGSFGSSDVLVIVTYSPKGG